MMKNVALSLSANDIALLNPNTRTCPIFRSKRDMELTKAIYTRIPVLLKDGPPEENPWSISFNQNVSIWQATRIFSALVNSWRLTVGNLKVIFSTKMVKNILPLYEGKMIWHFDHRFGTYEGLTQADNAIRVRLPNLNNQHIRSLLQYRAIGFMNHICLIS